MEQSMAYAIANSTNMLDIIECFAFFNDNITHCYIVLVCPKESVVQNWRKKRVKEPASQNIQLPWVKCRLNQPSESKWLLTLCTLPRWCRTIIFHDRKQKKMYKPNAQGDVDNPYKQQWQWCILKIALFWKRNGREKNKMKRLVEKRTFALSLCAVLVKFEWFRFHSLVVRK